MKYLLRCIFLLPLRPSSFKVMLWLLRFARILPAKTPHHASRPRHILVVNFTDYLGDTVMMMPLLDRLHVALPNATIDVATSVAMAGYVREIPFLRHVFRLSTDKTRIPGLAQYLRLVSMVRLVHSELACEQYDLCLLPRWGTDPQMSSYFASMTSAACIIGHEPSEEIDTRNPFPGSSLMYSKVSRGGSGLPEGIRELRLLETCDIVDRIEPAVEEFQPIAALGQIADRVSNQSLRDRLGIGETPYVVLAPGASSAAKRWTPERFAAVAREIQVGRDIQILILGGPAEAEIGAMIAEKGGGHCLNLIRRTSLPETTSLLRQAALLIANDSGPAHIGAGLGVPTLVLSPSPLTCTRETASSPLRFRPVGPRVRVLQPPLPASGCGDRCLASTPHCILGLTVDEVSRHAVQLLDCESTTVMANGIAALRA